MALQSGSLVHQIANLEPGGSYCRTQMIGLSAKGLEDKVREAKRKLKNHLNKQAERASAQSGNTYRLDSGTWLAAEDAAVFVTIAITRVI